MSEISNFWLSVLISQVAPYLMFILVSKSAHPVSLVLSSQNPECFYISAPLRNVVSSSSIDLACIVEMWLQEHIHDNIISIPDFNVVRRDRVNAQHGGVCVYERRAIKYKVLQNLFNTHFEAIWLVLNPPRLPRGISNIILCTVYHPTRADDLSMLNYLYECLTIIEAEFPSCSIIMLGDFNKLNTFRLQNAFKLKQIIKFSTRGQNTLDLILTNSKSFTGTQSNCHHLYFLTMLA